MAVKPKPNHFANRTVLPHFMLHAGICETYQKLVGESLVPIPACWYKAGDAGVSGDALCRRWECTSYLLTDDEDHTGQTDDEEDSEEEGEEEDN